MSLATHSFATEQEARAFQKGVEYVNDSAVQVIKITFDETHPRPWLVICEDEDEQSD